MNTPLHIAPLGAAQDDTQTETPFDIPTEVPAKPTRYYIDFENVHGTGLKGVDELPEGDEVYIFFSQAAETFHIEHAIGIMNSKARVEFVEIDGGTRNALDFQLVAALFGTMSDDFDYAIVTGDVGFDAAIRMGERLGLSPIRRISDLTGSTEPPQLKRARQKRTRQDKSDKQDRQEKQGSQNKPATKGKEKEKSQAKSSEKNGGAAGGKAPEKTKGAEVKGDVKDDARPQHDGSQNSPAKAEGQTHRTKRTRSSQQKLPAGKEPEQLPASDEPKGALPTANAKQMSPEASPAASGDAPAQETAAPAPQAEAAPAPDATPETAPEAPTSTASVNAPEPEQAPSAPPASSAPVEPANEVKSETGAGTEEESGTAQDDREHDAPAHDDTPEEKDAASGRSGRYSKRKDIRDMLAGAGAEVSSQQLASVMKALNGVKNKQSFYQRIIQNEGRERGLELYRQVRDHYEVMLEILRA